VADLGTVPNKLTVRNARRSTRISESVRFRVSGQNKLGGSFSELTLTLAVNCHGCIYPSQSEPRIGSWVTLEFLNQQSDPNAHPVRAQVRFVGAPRSPNEHYQVGVELETPANAWGIGSAPKDWLRFPVLVKGTVQAITPPVGPQVLDPAPLSTGTTEPTPKAPTPPPDPGRLDRMAFSSDQLLRALEKNLQLAAEKAVASAVTSQMDSAVNQAKTVIEKLSQASVRQVEEYCARFQEKLITSAHDELLIRLQADLTHAEERLQKQLEVSLTEFQETTQGVAKRASSETRLVLAESLDFLKETARDLQGQFSTQLRETTDRAAAELSAETVRFSDRQLALLAEQAQVAIGEGSTLLDTRAAEASSQLETAANTMLGDFHQKASIEIDQAAIKVRQNFKSSLPSFTDEIRANWEARQRACEDAVARSSENQAEQFRQRLEAILRSSMVNAISAVNEHSSALLNSLSKETEEQLKEATHRPASS
jgi:hypothetical protein